MAIKWTFNLLDCESADSTQHAADKTRGVEKNSGKAAERKYVPYIFASGAF